MSEPQAREEIKKLRSQGILSRDHESFDGLRSAVGVYIETVIPGESTAKPLDFTIDVINKKGSIVSFSDFNIRDEDGLKILSFYAYMKLPQNVELTDLKVNATACSFTDFCWLNGNEVIKRNHQSETLTRVRPDTDYGDIGWQLPCRFADRLLDALGIANDFLFEGVLEDAILYGVYVKEK